MLRTSQAVLTVIFMLAVLLPASLLAEEQLDETELEAIRDAAQAAISETEQLEEKPETTFKSGSLGLQRLNPEISVTGDFLFSFRNGEEVAQETDFSFRGLGLHFEAYLDPYSRFKAAVPVSSGGAALGEGFFTRYGVLGVLNVTIGKFRQQFGVVNRWHKHGLDYVDFPLPLRQVFGNGGLNQTGLSFESGFFSLGLSQELVVQLTDGENGRIFAENSKNRPSILGHYKFYRDISQSTYLELGLTGLAGWNDTWTMYGTDTTYVQDTQMARVYGLDLTLLWEPPDRMRYRNFEWRTELYYVDKDVLNRQESEDTLNPWGVYSSVQAKLSRTIELGGRFDYYEPEGGKYDDLPMIAQEDGANDWMAVAYLTWFQSPFVKFRVQYEHENGTRVGEPEDRLTMQYVFAAGPHKHERY